MNELIFLRNLIIAPYLLRSTALIGVERKVGGNQFRHCFATLGILIDYKYYNDSVLLKASLLHDFIEDWGNDEIEDIKKIDEDGPDVIKLVLEVTRSKSETKLEYLERLQTSSYRAKVLKCADRISNLTDLHLDTHTNDKISQYLEQTEKYILPLAREVNENFEKEIKDLISKRRNICK